MRYIYEKETLKRTRKVLNDFKDMIRFMDKESLNEIAQGLFNDKNIHFDDLISIRSPAYGEVSGGSSNVKLSEVERYIAQREYRIGFIEKVTKAIFELNNDKNRKYHKVLLYRYVYGHTVKEVADFLNKDERVIARWSKEAEIEVAVYLNTFIYI